CRLRPRATAILAMRVARRVVRGRGRDAVARQAGRDGVQACAFEELGEDPLHDRSTDRIGCELAQPLANRRLAGIRVRTDIDEGVAIRWPAAEEASFDRSLRGHRGADAGLDASALALAHPAVQAHHKVVRFGPGINGATNL